MDSTAIKIKKALRESGIRTESEVLGSRLTSFGIGGPVDLLVFPRSEGEVSEALRLLSDGGIPVYPLGRGTNLLISDRGFRGAMIKTDIQHCRAIRNGLFEIGAGVRMEEFVETALDAGYAGPEAFGGIPGSIGGGIAMNAGAWDAFIGDFVDDIVAFDLSGEEIDVIPEGVFDYRKFALRGKSVVASASFSFTEEGNPEHLIRKAEKFRSRRAKNQPVRERSAGCVFRNPPGDHAGKIIDELGLKGFSEGGAVVSEKHANFIVNRGGASAEDILKLVDEIRNRVRKERNIELKLEIIKIGF